MDVNRMRKNTEKRMKAYSIRYKMSKGIKDYHGWRQEKKRPEQNSGLYGI